MLINYIVFPFKSQWNKNERVTKIDNIALEINNSLNNSFISANKITIMKIKFFKKVVDIAKCICYNEKAIKNKHPHKTYTVWRLSMFRNHSDDATV